MIVGPAHAGAEATDVAAVGAVVVGAAVLGAVAGTVVAAPVAVDDVTTDVVGDVLLVLEAPAPPSLVSFCASACSVLQR